MSRTAAGRRALQLALLVGGLFMLGFLCGEQAHAAEGGPVAPVRSVRPPAGQESAAGDVVRDTAPHAARDVLRGTVRTVTVRAVTPVRNVVRTASQALEQTPSQALEQTASQALKQTASQALGKSRAEAPALPAAPSVPLPELPGVSESPGDPLPAPAGPEPRSPRQTSAAPTPGKDDHGIAEAGTEARTAVPARPQAAVYGPDLMPAVPTSPAHTPAHRATASADAPARPAPAGDPDGVLGKQVADGSASRHGDAHAVTPDSRAPLRLLPGTAARADASGPLERHRDIPVFPG